MIMRVRIIPVLAAAVLSACADSGSGPDDTGLALSGFLNASSAPVDVLVDGVPVLTGVATSVVRSFGDTPLAAGAHEVRVRSSGTTTGGAVVSLTVAPGDQPNIYAFQPPGSALSARAFADTGAVVPAGKSKVRVVNLAAGSDIDIWRTQPDYQTPIRFQFPFPFDPEPGPYLQSDAGTWHVWITSTGDWSTRLSETGPITIPSGEKRTIVVVDSAGHLRLRVLVD